MTAQFKRRQLLKLLGAGSLVAGGASQAFAGRAWWEGLRGFGHVESSTSRRPPRKREKIPLNDLRPGNIPLRSDEMLIQMDAAIERMSKIAARGRWPRMPKVGMLRPDDDHEAVDIVRRILAASGDMPARTARATAGSYNFDRYVEAAVKRFQQRHGLRPTGRLDRPTRAQLAVSPQARLKQLRLNRQRVAALVQGRIADRYIMVNTASFELEAVERYEVHGRHRVIVGKPDRQTPTIAATIEGLNFFPYWRVPMSIARKDLFPRLVREPEYLEKEHIRVLSKTYDGQELDPTQIDWRTADAKIVKFRQDPGPWNALGLVRINMPNEHIVYMHDTPLKPLFGQRYRAFSAGCVRVQGVMDLVAWIASYEPGFGSEGAVAQILERGQPVDIKLTRPIPVHFTYITAWAEADGSLQFRPDIYGRDGAAELVGTADPDAIAAAPRTFSP
ncbi:MAG: L,D-transpeptidase family protein [Hyphomicrobiaceae bacterium]